MSEFSMLNETRQGNEQHKFELRNFQRKLWNAQHTYESNRGELKVMVSASEGGGRITRQVECIKYWQSQVEKFEGRIFLHCLKHGLDNETGWT